MIANSLRIPERIKLSEKTIDCLLPSPRVRSWDWMRENSYNHKGQPFNHVDYPWMEGIADAWDDPGVRRIFVMAGSRLGKTEEGLCLMQASQANDPDIGMIIAPTESLVRQTIGDRFWKMLMRTHATKHLCPPVSRQSRTSVRTKTFTIFGAWSGSPTTLGDKDPRYIVLYEIDKYDKSASEEADPFLIAMERGAEIPDRKLYAESTPTVERRSRIERHVKMATNRRYHVPCPHCGHHQELRLNDSDDRNKGGLTWDRTGNVTPNQVAKTAVYICEGCKEEIREYRRRAMIKKGVWCAQGQRVKKNGTLVGRPDNEGPDESFQISRLYGPTFTFSDYARAYFESRGNSEAERSFANNWAGETWVPLISQMEWEQLAKRLCVGDWEPGIVPKEVNFITTSIDVQIDHFVCTAWGWDRHQVGRLIAYGTIPSWNDVRDWCYASYPHQDGGPDLHSFVNLIDSRDGNRKDEILDFCQAAYRSSGPFVWPSMGARPGSMNLQPYRKLCIDQQKNVGRKVSTKLIEGMYLIMVNTTFTQEWLDNAMLRRRPGDPKSMVLPRSIADDRDFFEQLLNEAYDREKNNWVRLDETTVPVDFRDCVRYARAAAEVFCGGNWSRIPALRPRHVDTKSDRVSKQQRATEKKKFVRRPTHPRFLRRRT